MLLFWSLLSAQASDVFWDGFYRSQAHYYDSLSLSDGNTSIDRLSYANHWMSLRPKWAITDKVSLHSQMDMLYQQGFGDSAFLYQDPAYSSSILQFSEQVLPNSSNPLNNILISRAWAEINSDIGMIRFGRMPVHWGAGMIFNAGMAPTQFVGDTADRIQYSKQFGPVFLLAALENRQENYISVQDDSNAATFSLFYAGERVQGGIYNVLSKQRSETTEFGQYTGDISAQADLGALDLEFEFALQYGSGSLDNGLDDVTQLAFGGVLDAQLQMDEIGVGFNVGYASGDTDLNDKKFTQFSFDRNYDISLMLFDQVMPTLSPLVINSTNMGLETSAARVGNGISNAMYIQPRVSYKLSDTFTPELRALFAKAAALPDDESNPNYGLEIDATLNYQPVEKFLLRTQLGYFMPGSYISSYTDEDFGGGFDQNAMGAEINAIIRF